MEPSFREPMLATLVDDPQLGDEWWFERKLDGIRLIAVRDGDRVRLWSRNGLDRSASYPELIEALAAQRYDRFVVDGEVVAFDGDQTSFSLLQQRSGVRQATQALGRGVEVFFYVFDLLHLDGVDLEPFELRAARPCSPTPSPGPIPCASPCTRAAVPRRCSTRPVPRVGRGSSPSATTAPTRRGAAGPGSSSSA